MAGSLWCVVYCLATTIVFIARGEDIQHNDQPDPLCCSANLVDSMGHVVLDRASMITLNNVRIRSFRIKMCRDFNVFLQLWSPTTRWNEWKLDWSHEVIATQGQVHGAWRVEHVQDKDGLVISPQHRVALFTPDVEGQNTQIPVPFTFDERRQMIHSNEYSLPGNMSKMVYSFDELNFPRSFDKNIRFCEWFGCPTSTAGSPALIYGRVGHGSVPGAKQPEKSPGSNGFSPLVKYSAQLSADDFGADGTMKGFYPNCGADSPDLTGTKLQDVVKKTEILDRLLITLNDTVAGLRQFNNVTSTCPHGFSMEKTGKGYCYKFITTPRFSFGEAALYCNEYYNAWLMDLQTVEENDYIAKILEALKSDRLQTDTFWTTGMYNPKERAWFWSNELSEKADLIDDDGAFWAPGQPKYNGGMKICMYVALNNQRKVRWYSDDCRRPRSFICKMTKDCL